MLFNFIIFICVFNLKLFSTELPQFTVVKNVLEESEISQLNQITKEVSPELLWYNRLNFWKEMFEVKFDSISKAFVFIHSNKHKYIQVSDKLSNLFLHKIQEFGLDITKKKIVIESYFDRNVVDLKNSASSGMSWHRDIIVINGERKFSDFTMILLTNGKIQNWQGGDLILQVGGEYTKEDRFEFINLDNPKVILKPCYNQAIIFKNSNTGHMVTPLTLLSDTTVERDVFIVNCYLQ